MLYSSTYNAIPAIRFTQPSMAISNVFCISLAPILMMKTTAINTSKNENAGSHLPAPLTFLESISATTADNLTAAASPTINAITENNAMIKPLR